MWALENKSNQKNQIVSPNSDSLEKADGQANLPSELLILNRFGIQQNQMLAALKLAHKYKISASEVLIRANIITPNIWHEAQQMLFAEQERAKQKRFMRENLLLDAVHGLKENLPEYSAFRTFTIWQIAFGAFFITAIALATNFQISLLLLIGIILITLFYTGGVLMRGLMLASFQYRQVSEQALINMDNNALPTYSLLIALYKESGQIDGLTKALQHIEWPKHKLDIKLICEEDDVETISAIRAAKLPSYFDLIIVPEAQPRTKPKALNFALPLCQGEYAVLYDAEDRPSPLQLREAYAKFMTESDDLMCLQAPLEIHNANQSWLSRMFAIEYITLFNGILPVLAKWKVPIPLGGTSNHFKIDKLREIGAWDPFNVTEDADLGIRIYRHGYRCSTLSLPTYEEAPPEFTPWVKQRTRWLKGWMQTILVHNRNPARLIKEMGIRNALAFHLFLTSIVISVMIHPVFLYLSLQQLFYLPSSTYSGIDSIFILTSIFNLVGGYTTYGLLAYAVLQATDNGRYSKSLLLLPFYWLIISLAGWRAFIHLLYKPHVWEKTPHGLFANSNSH